MFPNKNWSLGVTERANQKTIDNSVTVVQCIG